jgi:hypothetical protein
MLYHVKLQVLAMDPVNYDCLISLAKVTLGSISLIRLDFIQR